MVQTQTGFVQVPLHLHRRLHLHAVLEKAAAERGLVVGLPRRGLDGRLHPGLRHSGGDDQGAPHSLVVVRPVRPSLHAEFTLSKKFYTLSLH